MITTICQGDHKSMLHRARELYVEAGINFDDDLRDFLADGYVHFTPRYFLMGRQIGNGWFIQCAIGENCLQEFFRLMPYPLPLIGFRRHSSMAPVKWHDAEKLQRKINYARNTITPKAPCSSNVRSGGQGPIDEQRRDEEESSGIRRDDTWAEQVPIICRPVPKNSARLIIL
jgi:hypothetical protein